MIYLYNLKKTYIYILALENECKPCDKKCVSCSHESTYCNKCRNDLNNDEEGKALILKYNRCLFESTSFECENGTFFDFNTNECQYCDLTCLECTSDNNCIKCSERKPLLQLGMCVQECDDGFFLDESSKNCFKCASNCVKCSKDKCLTCAVGYQLINNKYCGRFPRKKINLF